MVNIGFKQLVAGTYWLARVVLYVLFVSSHYCIYKIQLSWNRLKHSSSSRSNTFTKQHVAETYFKRLMNEFL